MIDKLIAEVNSLSLSGNFEDAIKLLEQCLDKNPGQHEMLLLLWKNCLATGNHDKAEQAIQDMIDASDDPETLRTVGAMLYSNGGTTQAITVYQKYLELRPINRAVWIRLAALQRAAGDIAAAIDSYYRVIELEPENVNAGAQLARLLFSQQRADDAEAVLAGILKHNPDEQEICYLYAGLLTHAGKLGEAMDYSTRALDGAPYNTMYRLRQADINELRGEADKAFEVLKPLLEHKNVSFDAVRIFSKISPALRMKHEAGMLLDYLFGRDEVTGPEREAIANIRDWLAQS